MLKVLVKTPGWCLQCLKIETGRSQVRRLAAVRKRFYKSVTVTESSGVFEVNIDNKKLKTPGGRIFQVPNQALALAVANEWDTQDSIIRLSSMHLTGLCNTAIDNPIQRTKENLSEAIVNFLDTDTICFRQEQPEELQQLQIKQWDPVINWINERYAVKLEVSNDICGPSIAQNVKDTFQKHLMSFNLWSLMGFEFAADSVKSLLLTLAVADRHLPVEEAVRLSRLELEFQIKKWGSVEWHHDIELMDTRARLAAATLFIYATSHQSDIIKRISK